MEFGILRIEHIMMTKISLNKDIMYNDNLLHDELGTCYFDQSLLKQTYLWDIMKF